MEKRIANEVAQLIEYEQTQSTPREIVQIKESNTIILGDILFVIHENYPFRPPTIHIKDQPYIYFAVPQNTRIRRVYDKLLHNGCLWCDSITNRSNWSPSNRLFTILIEIETVNHVKRTLREILTSKRYLSIICEKYNIPIYHDIRKYLYDSKYDDPSVVSTHK